MNVGILTSATDEAGKNIRERLIKRGFSESGEFEGSPTYTHKNFTLVETAKSLLEVENLPFNMDAWIFASKHVSKAGKNSLTAHFPGNWNDAKYGGEPESFALALPSMLKTALSGLKSREIEGYEVTLEATHHGPTSLDKPVMFLEIGSNTRAWNDFEAVDIIVKTILDPQITKFKPALGFGGGHYPITLTKLILETDFAFGHIGPKYATYNERNLENAIDKTIGAKFCVVDKEGLRKNQREIITKVARDNGLEVLMPIDIIDVN